MSSMPAGEPIAHWIGFHVAILILIACDLILLNGKKKANLRADLLFVIFLVALAAAFGAWLAHIRGHQIGLEFASGYLIELSLSVDNLFVFLLMFRSFGLKEDEQRKVLLLGILGAIIMRGVFILSGIALLERFAWIQYVFGAFLLVAALRLLTQKRESSRPGRWAEKLGRQLCRRETALLSAVLAIEFVDLIFALDSIPAVLAVSHDPFVVYTSNICAILGLRSLYFLLANMLDRMHFLHFGLAAVLGFVGCKMLFAPWIHLPVTVSLGVIVGVLTITTAASLLYPAPGKQHAEELKRSR